MAPEQPLQRPGALQERQWPKQQHLHRPGALLQRCTGQQPAVAASVSVAGAFCGYRSSTCTVWERCRGVLWPQKQQLQFPGSLQECAVVPEAAVTAIGEQGRSDLWVKKHHQLQRRGVLLERSVGPEEAVAPSWSLERCRSVAGALQRPAEARLHQAQTVTGAGSSKRKQ